ncbi:hypothetical protein [uncultured Mailhella sp.]|uniref:hypothetical protein n=1 Tax=uncultured Mailhella sp. TaxID=1981031 RepID=UPI00261F3F7F|nr:hypothetical protein [uncultured Mailhella sp.]
MPEESESRPAAWEILLAKIPAMDTLKAGSADERRLKYWSNIFGMIGVALVATAFFRTDDWQLGTLSGAYFIGIGAWFHGLSLPSRGGKK